jgi:hypothetical protein
MRTTVIVFAGAMLSLAACAAAIGSSAEERYRAKYGRYTSAEGARKKTAANQEEPACCRNLNASLRNVSSSQAPAEALFRAKYGRNTAMADARERQAAHESAKRVRSCVELGQCKLMEASTRAVDAALRAPAESWWTTRLRTKYGNTFSRNTERELVLSEVSKSCEHACCRFGE